MNKKIAILSLSFLLFIIALYQIVLSEKCKSKEFIISVKSLGLGVITECYNQVDLKENVKRISRVNKNIYNLLSYIKIKFLPEYGKSRDIYQSYEFNKNYEKKFFSKVKNIEGITSDKKKLKKFHSKFNKEEIDLKSWQRSHGNNWNTKYFDSELINKSNIDQIVLRWKYNPIETSYSKKTWKSRIGINPIYADGIVYFVSANWELIALEADNGKLVWSKEFNFEIGKRGILYHFDKAINKSFILVNSGSKIYKVNAKNGKLEKKFGLYGSVNVEKSLIPPVIYKNFIILTNIKGEIIGLKFDTGEKVFKKQINKKYDFKLYSVPWGGAALDIKNGIYFVVTGNPRPYHVGIFRPGDNKNANSIIAFGIKEKKILWTFQDVIHDLWNLDVSAPPILANIEIDNNNIETVIVTTKTGNVLFFERKSGKPIYDINYKNAPHSNVPGEFASEKQIFLKKPQRFSKIEFEIGDLKKKYLDDNEYLDRFKKKNNFGWFAPPTFGKKTVLYGIVGGNNWYGSAYDPKNKKLYIPSTHIPYFIRIFPISKSSNSDNIMKNENFYLYEDKCSSCHGKNRNGMDQADTYEMRTNYVPSIVGLSIFESLKSKMKDVKSFNLIHKNNVQLSNNEFIKIKKLFKIWDVELKNNNQIGLNAHFERYVGEDKEPITKPPYGTITAMDMKTGLIDWKVPFGYKNKKNIGVLNVGGISVSSGNLIFATGTIDNYAFIIDSVTGKELWKFKMEAQGTAPPLIYEYEKKQYFSFLSTGGINDNSKKSSTLYTFSLK